MTTPKKWVLLRFREGRSTLYEVDASSSRLACGDSLRYYRTMNLGNFKPEFCRERGLDNLKNVDGEPLPMPGPITTDLEAMQPYGETREVSLREMEDWSDLSDEWCGLCDEGYQIDVRRMKSARSSIVTATESVLKRINKDAENGEVPRLRLEK